MKGLTKENLWDKLSEKYPGEMAHFATWIDKYMGMHKFGLFDANNRIPFSELPFAMQLGIFIQYAAETGGGVFELEVEHPNDMDCGVVLLRRGCCPTGSSKWEAR